MQDEIADIIMKEVGKGYKDAKKEVVRTADFIRYTIEEAFTYARRKHDGR